MYEVEINNKKFQIEKEENSFYKGKINGASYQLDTIEKGENAWHVIHNNQSYTISLISQSEDKTFEIKVNDTVYSGIVKDEFDLLLKELGMDSQSVKKVNEIKAPMPGLVVDVLVKPGDTIAEGDGLIVLEAMKMENILKSPGEAVIKSIEVEKSNSVEKNQILIHFE